MKSFVAKFIIALVLGATMNAYAVTMYAYVKNDLPNAVTVNLTNDGAVFGGVVVAALHLLLLPE